MANLIGLKDFEAKSSKEYRKTMLEIERHMNDSMGDDALLAWILGGGKTNYINTFMREFRTSRGVDSEMPRMLFELFVQTWRQRYGRLSPGAYLDSLHVTTPPTDKDIEDAWEVESGSSDDARRYFGMA